MESGAVAALDAMVGPQRLAAVVHHDGLEGLLALVAGREARMAGRMPVLRHDEMVEILGQRVDQRHHLVAAGNRKRAARAEIVLYIDDDQRLFHAILQALTRKVAGNAPRRQPWMNVLGAKQRLDNFATLDIICVRMNFLGLPHDGNGIWFATQSRNRSTRRSLSLAKARGASWRAAPISIRRLAPGRSPKTCSTSTACPSCAASQKTPTHLVDRRAHQLDRHHPSSPARRLRCVEAGGARGRLDPDPEYRHGRRQSSATHRLPPTAFRRC